MNASSPATIPSRAERATAGDGHHLVCVKTSTCSTDFGFGRLHRPGPTRSDRRHRISAGCWKHATPRTGRLTSMFAYETTTVLRKRRKANRQRA